jgi:hypothetical protein
LINFYNIERFETSTAVFCATSTAVFCAPKNVGVPGPNLFL